MKLDANRKNKRAKNKVHLILTRPRVTDQSIPIEFGFAVKVADLLVLQGRSFHKPLRYDGDADLVLPDFVLTDAGREVPMEVFGRSDPAYLARRAEKERYYDTTYGDKGWWRWDAAANPAIQPFRRCQWLCREGSGAPRPGRQPANSASYSS